jgi:hypothetical protein
MVRCELRDVTCQVELFYFKYAPNDRHAERSEEKITQN